MPADLRRTEGCKMKYCLVYIFTYVAAANSCSDIEFQGEESLSKYTFPGKFSEIRKDDKNKPVYHNSLRDFYVYFNSRLDKWSIGSVDENVPGVVASTSDSSVESVNTWQVLDIDPITGKPRYTSNNFSFTCKDNPGAIYTTVLNAFAGLAGLAFFVFCFAFLRRRGRIGDICGSLCDRLRECCSCLGRGLRRVCHATRTCPLRIRLCLTRSESEETPNEERSDTEEIPVREQTPPPPSAPPPPPPSAIVDPTAPPPSYDQALTALKPADKVLPPSYREFIIANPDVERPPPIHPDRIVSPRTISPRIQETSFVRQLPSDIYVQNVPRAPDVYDVFADDSPPRVESPASLWSADENTANLVQEARVNQDDYESGQNDVQRLLQLLGIVDNSENPRDDQSARPQQVRSESPRSESSTSLGSTDENTASLTQEPSVNPEDCEPGQNDVQRLLQLFGVDENPNVNHSGDPSRDLTDSSRSCDGSEPLDAVESTIGSESDWDASDSAVPYRNNVSSPTHRSHSDNDSLRHLDSNWDFSSGSEPVHSVDEPHPTHHALDISDWDSDSSSHIDDQNVSSCSDNSDPQTHSSQQQDEAEEFESVELNYSIESDPDTVDTSTDGSF